MNCGGFPSATFDTGCKKGPVHGHGLGPPSECGVLLQDTLQAHPWGARAPASLPAHGPEARHRTPVATMVLFKRFKGQYGLFGQSWGGYGLPGP